LVVVALGTLTLLFAPGHAAYAQIPSGCKCKPIVSLNPDTSCNCPDITLTNLTVSRFGKCSKVLGNCTGVSTLSCHVEGTVSESGAGCTGGFVDVPFTLDRDCVSFDNMTDVAIACTGGIPGQDHRVRLNCEKCKQ
jgi:hypothetical protein